MFLMDMKNWLTSLLLREVTSKGSSDQCDTSFHFQRQAFAKTKVVKLSQKEFSFPPTVSVEVVWQSVFAQTLLDTSVQWFRSGPSCSKLLHPPCTTGAPTREGRFTQGYGVSAICNSSEGKSPRPASAGRQLRT